MTEALCNTLLAGWGMGLTLPRFYLQPVAVDFVDKRLPRLHPAFAQHRYKYNSKLDRYICNSVHSPTNMPIEEDKPHVKPPKTLSPPEIILSMRFWDTVFSDAMKRLQESYEEPKGRRDTVYNIRDLKSWDEVYYQLESCRERYLDDHGWTNKVKRGWRTFSENIGPVQETWNLVPDVDYLTPIRGAVDFLLDAIRRASETRQQILQGLDRLDSMFRDIELFLIVFPTDEPVLQAGTELVVSVLAAVEKLIGFYIKSRGRKALSSLFTGEDYEKDVISSLGDITTKSETLRYEATKADMSQSAKNWRLAETSKIIFHLELNPRSHHDSPGHEELRRTLSGGHDEILQRQASLKAHSEDTAQKVNSVYNLLVEWELVIERNAALQKRNEELEKSFSDLRYINVQLQRALTPNMPSISHTDCYVKQDDLWDLFSVFSFEDQDMQYITEKQEQLPFHERAMSENLVSNTRFREWMVFPTSRELLIQGSLTGDRQISTLSVFCSTTITAIRGRPNYISLVHFCGLHADIDYDVDAGPRGMIMSFIAQLLCQWDFDTTFLHGHVDLSWIEYGGDPSKEDLYGLLNWLVRQLPSSQTIFFVIDGAYHYERSDHVGAFIDSVAFILGITLDEGVTATVKVLVTSPCRTAEVREGFHHDAVLLLIEESGVGLDSSYRRFQHQVTRAFETK
ncbi:hypothetical protein F5Y09DRAFT_350194 [Xylaria sp. FL1042]|nr:hypothetical protein F5Y09DRAFT_350194 [Xylaria sp. FL1042]